MRKLISLIMALVIASSTTVQIFADNTEQPSAWAAGEVNAAIAANLVPQNLQSNYTQAITRAEFATLAVMLYEALRGEIEFAECVPCGPLFTDTDDINVEKAEYIGVVQGVGDNRFDPDGTLTREQAAVMLARLASAMDMPLPNNPPETFADAYQISSWAVDAVGQVRTVEIMGGIGDNLFAPQQPYTREQSIVTIFRVFVRLQPTSTPNPNPPRTHTVLPGQSLINIAMIYYNTSDVCTLNQIAEANNMSVDAPLFVGQVLIIPDLAECSITNDADNVEFVQEYHSRSIWLSTHQNQFPHAIVRNTDELQNFIQSYILQHWGNQFTDIEDYISEATSKFDETFFEERMLIFAYVETSTGAATAEVSEITYNELGTGAAH